MKGITLQRVLSVHCWRVIGQVATASKRTELLPVLLRARESGSTDADDIAEHLLFESASRRIVAQRLLRICELYGLIEPRDRRYVLTDTGRTALETEQIFVPARGTWSIWASNDPLLPTPILRVEPWSEPSAYDEILGSDREAARERAIQHLPEWLTEARRVISVPMAGGGAPIRIDDLEPGGEAVDPSADLRAVWDVSTARLRVEGTLSGTRVSAAIDAPDVTAEDAWRQLLESEGIWPQWDQQVLALRVAFEQATDGERESLVRAVTVQHPTIEGLDTFDSATVEGVALRPSSAADATQWAEWRLRTRIRDYATSERFDAWTAEAVSPFTEFQPSTPSRQTLATAAWRARAGRPAPEAWHLVAVEDWGL